MSSPSKTAGISEFSQHSLGYLRVPSSSRGSSSKAADISESPRVPAGSPAKPRVSQSPFEFQQVLQQRRGYLRVPAGSPAKPRVSQSPFEFQQVLQQRRGYLRVPAGSPAKPRISLSRLRVPAGSPAEPLSPFEFPRIFQQSRGYH